MIEISKKKKKISVVVSCYESKSTISEMYSKLLQIISPFEEYQFELVFVDDGSTDNTLRLLKDIVDNESKHIVKVIDLGKNQGQVSSILAGLSYTEGEAVIICSSDLQDPLELMATFVKEWEKGNDLVFGQRVTRHDGIVRKLGAFVWHDLILKTVNDKLPKGGADFGLITRQITDILLLNTSKHRFLQAEIADLAKNISFIPYERGKKKYSRKSTWTYSRLVELMIDISFIQFNLTKGYLYLSVFFIAFNSIIAYYCFTKKLSFEILHTAILVSLFFLMMVFALITISGIKFLVKNQNSTKAFHIKSFFSNKQILK